MSTLADIGGRASLVDYWLYRSQSRKAHWLRYHLGSYGAACREAARRAAGANKAAGVKTPATLLKYIGDAVKYYLDDPGRPDFDYWLDHMMPYWFMSTDDGLLDPRNRAYKPIHTPIRLAVSPHEIGGVWKSPASYEGAFYLHGGSLLPPDYFARLSALASLETGVHPHVRARQIHAPFHDFSANRGRCGCALAAPEPAVGIEPAIRHGGPVKRLRRPSQTPPASGGEEH